VETLKNDIHLFFLCDLPINIWSDQNINLHAHLIQLNDDIQHVVVTLLSNNHSEANLCRFFFLTWYIWKVRNDESFQRKKWSYMQVIKVAEAHMNNHLSALEKLQPSNSSHQQTKPSQQPTTQPNNVPTHASLSPNQQHYNDQGSSPHPYMLANLVNPIFNVPTINQPWQASSRTYCYIDASTTRPHLTWDSHVPGQQDWVFTLLICRYSP
jgi:hypothetical protein